jgi:phospholipid/cholesterol/gamma-HCH transport system ATP-binding protein
VIDELIKEITEEFNTTTIVITHDMNSVMETGREHHLHPQGPQVVEGRPRRVPAK